MRASWKDAAGDIEMSSTEQAPEPTMDEILASIRRIIADDDPNANGAAAPAAGEASEPPSPADQIADALGADPGSDAQLDDILELTREIGRQPAPAPVAEAEAPVAPPPLPAAEPVQAPVAAAPPRPMAEPAPPAQAAPAPQPQMAPAPAAEMPAPQPTQPPEPSPVASAPTDPAAALEGLLASVSEQSAQRTPPPLPASVTSDAPDHALEFDTQPVAAPAPEPNPAVGQLDSDDQAARLAAEVEAALGTSQFEPQEAPATPASPEASIPFEDPTEDEGLDLSELDDTPSDFAELDALSDTLESEMSSPPAEEQAVDDVGVEPVAESPPVESALANGAAAPGRTLEDSVKEMLRPMLREWLDNNMPRILEGAVKEELSANKERDE